MSSSAPDDRRQFRGRADPSQGHAGHFGDAGGGRFWLAADAPKALEPQRPLPTTRSRSSPAASGKTERASSFERVSGSAQHRRNSAAIGPFTPMIAISILPAAYKALKATRPTTDGAAAPGGDGMIRIWLDRKIADQLGRLRGAGES